MTSINSVLTPFTNGCIILTRVDMAPRAAQVLRRKGAKIAILRDYLRTLNLEIIQNSLS